MKVTSTRESTEATHVVLTLLNYSSYCTQCPEICLYSRCHSII